MVFALLLEFPLSKWIYGAVNYESIAINTLFPPILMLLIISFFKVPGEDNTRNIYNRLVDIIDADKSFETTVAYMPKKGRIVRSGLTPIIWAIISACKPAQFIICFAVKSPLVVSITVSLMPVTSAPFTISTPIPHA